MSEILYILRSIITRGLESYGVFYSSYRGIVVDNEDPQYLHRVKLTIPQITGDQVYNEWVFPKGLRANKHEGFQMIPKKGELVWVEFELGNPRRPIYSYGYRGTSDFINPALRDYNLVWYRTSSGHLILVDDTNKAIHIESSGGKTISIKDTISLGSKDSSDEPAVLGDTLANKLSELVEILQTAISIPNATFPPDTQAKLQILKSTLSTIKSRTVTLDK